MDTDLTLDDRVISALRRIVRAIDLHSRHLVDRFGVTGPQLVALQELARLGHAPVGVLARNVHVSHPTMTGILDRLAKRGLIQRTQDPADRRRMTVTATQEGHELLSRAPSPIQDRFRARFSRLEEWEQTHMLATLQRIATMMDAETLDAAPVLTTGTAVGPSIQPDADTPYTSEVEVQQPSGVSADENQGG